MSALSKANIIDKLMDGLNLSKQDARALVEGFFDGIRDKLLVGEHVKLSGFGNFVLRDKCSRPGRNPKTGKEISVSARRVVTFRPGMKLKEKVQSRTHR